MSQNAARIEEKIFSTPWSEQSFLEALEQEYTVFFAAKKKNTAWVTLELILLRMRRSTNVAVEMEYRRRHIAEALVAEMQKEAAGRGTHSIFLEVRCSNTGAIALSRKWDFPSAEPAGDFMKNQKKMPMLWYIHQRFPLPWERIKIL